MYKNKCVCYNEVTWVMTMKMRLRIKYRSHRYKMNRSRHGHKYATCKKCLSIMKVICISNTWARSEALLIKKVCILTVFSQSLEVCRLSKIVNSDIKLNSCNYFQSFEHICDKDSLKNDSGIR